MIDQIGWRTSFFVKFRMSLAEGKSIRKLDARPARRAVPGPRRWCQLCVPEVARSQYKNPVNNRMAKKSSPTRNPTPIRSTLKPNRSNGLDAPSVMASSYC